MGACEARGTGPGWAAVVLAAGQGTRMRSNLPKVLHPLLGRPLVLHVLTALQDLAVDRVVVVVGHGADAVREVLGGLPVSVAVQEAQLGTAHAVAAARPCLEDWRGPVLILCGDTPLVRPETLGAFMAAHLEGGRTLSVLTARVADPAGYGRILRSGEGGRLVRIVEERDAGAAERAVDEINTGIYAVESGFLFRALSAVRPENAQGEYYLTDIVEIGVASGMDVDGEPLASAEEALGVNSRAELARAEAVLLRRLRRRWMDSGVSFELAESVYLEPTVELEADVVVGPHAVLRGRTRVGAGARIGPFALLQDAEVPGGAEVPPFSHLVGRCRAAGG
ncbi:bifunctional N-acetylglucosamine-1-phosphate uridyltransferase/glucosamine-1-phosphate acetyltransferase [Dissulfurirhabdus thermomarina]|uniref:Bifunctional N-acetylglucosamine-1-phosphate uridyltransferase/glucosamine-1-phosphate acetyltransferase n=1 Tax=Dissulfurirhabdus thermomarina TaxID=1765737 RepID=A0A6N9TM07_DISTH|nr:NTP transferase domain-containing protein [Dissulfurirhabdus thermomarina]NDY42078.1 bifunctional N-acetylglucosamine-1-phosphate uridyltransferase/glucosamine-1-phosphate acetyltransferase [Dissulfurirhabdus thermomarina]NMX22828.1 bifunctional N-acetylglucosamine-1-phosphate uridyltransferase/glucosamine-1-phosphate acetyltransferase [Dissulfurirhabdus thermomarina]